MNIRTVVKHVLRPVYSRNGWIKETLRTSEERLDRLRHAAAEHVPSLIRPDPRNLYISLTAHCNLRCKACCYGRDFMPNQQLPLSIVKDLLDDAKQMGMERVRLYGGEPLLHKDLHHIVEHISQLKLGMWVTTNAVLLKEKIDRLFDAGLRRLPVGFYGHDDDYNEYVQRNDQFKRVEAGIAYTRERYGSQIEMHLDWLLMRPTCSLASVNKTIEFAKRYSMPLYINLIHYSLPYFTQHHDEDLKFGAQDRPQIEEVIAELLRHQERSPELFKNSATAIRSIPDWLILGPNMRVPCTEYRLIWVGPDGTVQMCYVTFKLGNLHEKRFAEMLFTPEHRKAAVDAFQLNCPNCHCNYDIRVQRHAPSRNMYQH